MVNDQPMTFSPARFLGPAAWVISLVGALISGLSMKGAWQSFALYLNSVPGSSLDQDPIFHKPLAFYLFSLPVYDLLAGWLTGLAFVIFLITVIYSLLALSQQTKTVTVAVKQSSFAAISLALAPFLVTLAINTYLSRFPYLWEDHQTFTGVTYAEANYLLPALLGVAIALLVAALLAVINSLTKRNLRLLIISVAIPIAVYAVGVILVPTYINSFIVKPNELERETPYIQFNIAATRRAFGLENIEQREFDAENSVAALDLTNNQATLDNIRLWDWRALREMRQIRESKPTTNFQRSM